MKRFVRKIIPNTAVNLLKHYPSAVSANLVNRFPSKGMTVIGVTGTDGKTTTTNLIYQILKASGKKVSAISTINAMIGDKTMDTGFHVTSPAAKDVQRYIAQAKAAGTEIMILEVTSHALDQYRFWGIKFDIGVITNITKDHLDYHKTFENYRRAKTKLIKNVKFAVLNKDDKNFDFLKKHTSGKVISVSLHGQADLNLKRFPLKLKLPGDYNLSNALEAAAVAQILGVSNVLIKKTLEHFDGLTGRMEEVKNNRGIKVYVDFAHTSNALKQALTALRQQKASGAKVISIFGCPGDRDPSKREEMGETSAKLADYTIITADDPRGMINEINKKILIGVKRSKGVVGKNVFIENDRQKAIDMAINQLAKKGDIVGIFGKGHEASMAIDGKHELPWSDRTAAVEALTKQT